MGYKVTKDKFKKFINIAIESGFHDEESAKTHLEEIIDLYNQLPNTIRLYRLIFLSKESDLNKEELGSHYVLNKKILISSHYDRMLYDYSKYENSKPYILTVDVPKNKIDFDETIMNNLMYPHEQEITLKDKGRGIDVISLDLIKR